MQEIEIKSLAELAAWLAANHAESKSVWLITYKKHTDHYVSYGEAIDELLCWGWVDSVSRRVDEDRSKLRISPRNPKSAWSAVNKEKVGRLRAEGRLRPRGEALIEAAQSNGMWEFLDDVERLVVPEDLRRALGSLIAVWEDWPRSVKRGSLEWVKTAKTAPTREKRIRDIAESAANGQRPSPFRR